MPPKKARASGASGTPARDHATWALKKADGEPFTREDIQFDLLTAIFQDQSFQFTSGVDQRPVTFGELYLEAIAKHSKAAKLTIKQLDEHPDWAFNFSVTCLLVNVGRLNTTVAFYPELRAYMRTFHSIPCLQRDEFSKKNLQDAPRIKTMLKSCVLPSEVGQSAASLPEIAKRSAEGFRPPTTVVNLIFELFSVEAFITRKYFPSDFTLHDLFLPSGIPAKLRAYAFLWLLHHFLEDPEAHRDFTSETPLIGFTLERGEFEPMKDSAEEAAWGKEMQAFRLAFLRKWKGEDSEGPESPGRTPRSKRQRNTSDSFSTSAEAEEQASTPYKRCRDVEKTGVFATEATPTEALQLSADALAKLDSEVGDRTAAGTLDPVALQFARIRSREERGVDPAVDSADEGDGPCTSAELKSRLIGFNFPQPGGKDVVVRYGAPVDTPSIEDSEDLAPVDSV